jgi:hypothetical protein
LVGWLVDGLVGWWVGWLVGWRVGGLVGWLVGGWLVGWLAGWLVGWWVGGLVVGWLIGWWLVVGWSTISANASADPPPAAHPKRFVGLVRMVQYSLFHLFYKQTNRTSPCTNSGGWRAVVQVLQTHRLTPPLRHPAGPVRTSGANGTNLAFFIFFINEKLAPAVVRVPPDCGQLCEFCKCFG